MYVLLPHSMHGIFRDCLLFVMAWEDVILSSKWKIIFFQHADKHNMFSMSSGFFLWSCLFTKDNAGHSKTNCETAAITYAKLKSYSVPFGSFLQHIGEGWFFHEILSYFFPRALFPRACISSACMIIIILHGYICDPTRKVSAKCTAINSI